MRNGKFIFFALTLILLVTPTVVLAQPFSIPTVSLSIGGADHSKASTTVQLIILLTILTVAPAILLMMTSFTRIVVVLSLLRHALSTQSLPPNQIIIGLALFLTFFIMAPTWQKINREALQPYYEERISGKRPLRWRKNPSKISCFAKRGKGPRPVCENIGGKKAGKTG